MIHVLDKGKCCGCTACYSACPRKCISMDFDDEGFLYPIVENNKCIDCGMCEKVCPILNKKDIQGFPIAFAVQHKDSDVLYSSAAGGAFSAIAAYVISEEGIVYGAAFNESFVVEHSSAQNISDIAKFSSSKYVQSLQKDNFINIKKKLQSGKNVCFSGTPCQVAGLKKYLGKEYDNLITVDLVCKGVASPEVLHQYVEIMTEKYGSKIIGMNFKRKTYGYHSSTMSVDFENGQTYSKGGITDLMMRSFRANICLRPSCSECQFKGKSRCSDFTIFDCWHYGELSGEKDDNRGHTAVLVHSQKGLQLLEPLKEYLDIKSIDLDKVVMLDGIMVENRVKAHPKREEFMKELKANGLEKAVDKCIPIQPIDRLKESSKRILYYLGLLDIVKKI